MTTRPGSPPELRKRSFLSKLIQGTIIVVLLAAVAGGDMYAVHALRRLGASRHWPGVIGVMREVGIHHDGWNRDEIKYVVDCGYRFTVNGATFAATNRLPEVFRTSFDADNWVAARRARGSYLTVFYNPRDPADCVLSPGWPSGALPCVWLLGIVSVGAAGWFGRRLLRLVTGKEDFVAIAVRPASVAGGSARGDDAGLASAASPLQRILRWLFALLGAVSCWWMAVSLYHDWGLPPGERTLPSAELIFVMEFILAHSGAMVAGMLADPNRPGKTRVKGFVFLAVVYMVFAVSIAAAGHSARLFATFSGILISRWVGLLLDSAKARQQQFLRSAETFLILFLSVIVFLVCLRLPLEVTLMVYFGLIGIFELTLPLRKRSFVRLPAVGST
jgi:Protein of unknown function (DUF3592)